MPAPAILLAFANDWADDRRRLRGLLEESKAIGAALAPLIEAGLVVPPPIHNAEVGDILAAFRARRYRGRIRVFHFGGHASGSALLFEDRAGAPAEVQAGALARYLGKQPGLVLAFLNGCCTEPQVRWLREAGVVAIVATLRAIRDDVAAQFAAAFYAELAGRPLREAFEAAVAAMRLVHGDDPRAVTRDVSAGGESGASAWPWILDCDPRFERWTLGAELGRDRRRTWRGRLGLAAAALFAPVIASLALSAEARRSACRAPGLRSVCAAIGAGGAATPAEQARWDAALAQRSGDGLRAYLRSYPQGAHADEARARLAACSTERTETLGEPRAVRYPLTVNPIRTRGLPTESEARRDAIARGNRDAADTCAPLALKAELASATAEPREWSCARLDGLAHGFACGFDGEIVCRVRDRIASDVERCRDD